MSNFLVLFILSFCAITGFAWLLIFCRRRVNRTRHGLSGMCHTSGGTMCSSCSEQLGKTDRCTNTPAGYLKVSRPS